MADYPDTETMIRELWDREQIRDIKYKNARHLDLKQWDEMGETFTEDADTSWVNGDLAFSGRKAIMDFLKSIPFADGDSVITVHQVAAMEIDFITKDHARGVSRLYNPMYHTKPGEKHLLLAFYRDEFKRIDGKWLISHTGHEYIYEDEYERGDLPSHKVNYTHPF